MQLPLMGKAQDGRRSASQGPATSSCAKLVVTPVFIGRFSGQLHHYGDGDDCLPAAGQRGQCDSDHEEARGIAILAFAVPRRCSAALPGQSAPEGLVVGGYIAPWPTGGMAPRVAASQPASKAPSRAAMCQSRGCAPLRGGVSGRRTECTFYPVSIGFFHLPREKSNEGACWFLTGMSSACKPYVLFGELQWPDTRQWSIG